MHGQQNLIVLNTMTTEEYRKLIDNTKKLSKMRNRRCIVTPKLEIKVLEGTKEEIKELKKEGISFDSLKEGKRYIELKRLENAGRVKDLQLQVAFILQPGFKDCWGKKHRPINYVADFVYYDNDIGRKVIEDTKGYRTEIYKLKIKMLFFLFKEMESTTLKFTES